MYPLNYIEPVFRPPSEWKSLILQVTELEGAWYKDDAFAAVEIPVWEKKE